MSKFEVGKKYWYDNIGYAKRHGIKITRRTKKTVWFRSAGNSDEAHKVMKAKIYNFSNAHENIFIEGINAPAFQTYTNHLDEENTCK